MLYLQKYLTNFQKPFFRWKKRKVAIGVVNFKAQTISFSNGNVTIFPTSRNCKNFNFPLYIVPAEMLYLQKYLTNFQKLFFRWKKRKVTIVIGNFKCTDIFVFQMQRYNFSNIPKIEKFQFFPHCPGRNAISPEVFNEFSKTYFSLKEEKGDYCHWKFQVHRHFRFPKATLQLFQHPKNVKISIFPFTLSWQKCYISRSI